MVITVKTKLDPLWDAFQVTQEMISEWSNVSKDQRLRACMNIAVRIVPEGDTLLLTYAADNRIIDRRAGIGDWIIFRGTWIDVCSDVSFKRTYVKMPDSKYTPLLVAGEKA